MKKLLFILLISLIGCEKSEISNDPTPDPIIQRPNGMTVGALYQGGVIAYIFTSVDQGYVAGQTHGIIAAETDQYNINSTNYKGQWGCSATDEVRDAQGTAIGTGKTNTIAISTACSGSPDIASRICSDLVLNSYDDWYLPSKDELNKLYINRVAIGGFTGEYYWSSSESPDPLNPPKFGYAWRQYFADTQNSAGKQNLGTKTVGQNVRAIRYF